MATDSNVKTKWTPGPWRVGIWMGDPQRKHVVDMLGGKKATFAMLTDRNSMFEPSAIVHSDGDRCEIEANAQLIAAAPELYRLLDLAVRQYDAVKGGPILGALEAARAVLAKARGEE